jgi:hypothetical protein
MDVDALDSTLDAIELSAMLAGCVYEVDMWLAEIKVDDPILIQFIIGHSDRSSLLWHEDGTTMIAVAEHMVQLGASIRCERPAGYTEKEPRLTMVSPSQVRDALSVYLLCDRRPDLVGWIEAEQD